MLKNYFYFYFYFCYSFLFFLIIVKLFLFSESISCDPLTPCINDCNNVPSLCRTHFNLSQCECPVDKFGFDCSYSFHSPTDFVPSSCYLSYGNLACFSVNANFTSNVISFRFRWYSDSWLGILFDSGTSGMIGGKGYYIIIQSDSNVIINDIYATGKSQPTLTGSPTFFDFSMLNQTIRNSMNLNNLIENSFIIDGNEVNRIGYRGVDQFKGNFQDVQIWRKLKYSNYSSNYFNSFSYQFNEINTPNNKIVSSFAFNLAGNKDFQPHNFLSKGRIVIDLYRNSIQNIEQVNWIYLYSVIIISACCIILFNLIIQLSQFNSLHYQLTKKIFLVHFIQNHFYSNYFKFKTSTKSYLMPIRLIFDFFSRIFQLSVLEFIFILFYTLTIIVFLWVYNYLNSNIPGSKEFEYVFGHLLTFHFPVVLLPINKFQLIFYFIFRIPFEKSLKYHRILGKITYCWLIIHFGTQINIQIYYNKFDVLSGFLFGIGRTHYGIGGTFFGFLGFLVVTVMILFSLDPIRRKCYFLFYWTHKICWPLLMVCIGLHNDSSGYALILPIILILFDKALCWYQYYHKQFSCESIQIFNFCSSGPAPNFEDKFHPHHCRRILKFQVLVEKTFFHGKLNSVGVSSSNKKLHYDLLGKYINITIPSISYISHPFSIAGIEITNNHVRITFYIAESNWNSEISPSSQYHKIIPLPFTSCLFQTIKSADSPVKLPFPFYIDGPHGHLSFSRSSKSLFDFSTIFICCTGIGVTPFFPILEYIINYCNESDLEEDIKIKTKEIIFIWVTQNERMFYELNSPLMEKIQLFNQQNNKNKNKNKIKIILQFYSTEKKTFNFLSENDEMKVFTIFNQNHKNTQKNEINNEEEKEEKNKKLNVNVNAEDKEVVWNSEKKCESPDRQSSKGQLFPTISYCRPNIKCIFEEYKNKNENKNKNNDTSIVLSCGSESFILDCCFYSQQCGFKFHQETFIL